MSPEFYQIYYRQHPLKGHKYDNRRDARKGLNILFNNIEATASLLGYEVKRRIQLQGNILAVQYTYSDGSTINKTFVIHRVRSAVVLVKDF